MERFTASFGFCLAHGARAAQYAAARRPLSYLYEYIIHCARSLIVQEIAGTARRSTLGAPLLCPTCESFQGSARRAAWFLAQLLHAPPCVSQTRCTILTAAVELLQRSWYCPVCIRLSTAESRAIALLFALLEAPQHKAAFDRGHGLCMPHFSRS